MKKQLFILFSIFLNTIIAHAQIALIKNFPNNAGVYAFEPINNLVIFNATGGLWRTDGTTAGTFLLTPNARFSSSSYRRCRAGNFIYFWGGNNDQGQTTLWKTDGTVTGTVLVKTFTTGNDAGPLVNLNGLLLFGFKTPQEGTEIWRSNGTESGTVIVTDLIPGPSDGMTASSVQSAVLNGYFYFQGPPGGDTVPSSGVTYALYRTNGTAAGTTRVPNGGYEPYGMNVIGEKLIYSANYPYTYQCNGRVITEYSRVLMKIEKGIVSILKLPATIKAGVGVCPTLVPGGITFLNTRKFIQSTNYLYFSAQPEGQNLSNLWRTDGTPDGTIALANLANEEGPVGGVFDQYSTSDFRFTTIAFFSIFTKPTGSELWRSDGTPEGTYLIRDINPGVGGSGPGSNTVSDYGPIDFRTVNGITYFFANDGTNGFELWQTDGTKDETKMVQDLNPQGSQSLSSYNDNFNGSSAGNTYFFNGDNGSQKGLYAICRSSIPTLSALPSTTICANASVTLTASNCAGSIGWNTGATTNSITVSPSASTTYSAICTQLGCLASTAVSLGITVRPQPSIPTLKALTCPLSSELKQWNIDIGGDNRDQLTIQVATLDGGYLLGGFTASAQGGDKSQPSRGGYDYWIVKINEKGIKLWDRRFGGEKDDYLNTVVVTADGGYLLGGGSESGQSGDKSQPSRGFVDYWVVKIDGNGTKLWDRSFGGVAYDRLSAIVPTSDGGHLLGGTSFTDQGGGKTQPPQVSSDYWVIKIDGNGLKLWDKRLGGPNASNLSCIVPTSDGGFLLGGYSSSGKNGDNSQPSNGLNDYRVVKIDQNGTKLWDSSFGGDKNDYLMSVVVTSDGGYLLGGYSNSGRSGDKSQPSNGWNDYWVVKINGNGKILWDKRFGGELPDHLMSVVVTPDGGYLLGGHSESGQMGDKSQPSQGMVDYWIVRIDGNGIKLWDRRFGGKDFDLLHSVLITPDGNFLLGGDSTSSQTGDKPQPLKGYGASDYWVLKVPECRELTGAVCAGTEVLLQSSGCSGTVNWSTGAIGAALTIIPQQTTGYTATCALDGCTSSSSMELKVTVDCR